MGRPIFSDVSTTIESDESIVNESLPNEIEKGKTIFFEPRNEPELRPKSRKSILHSMSIQPTPIRKSEFLYDVHYDNDALIGFWKKILKVPYLLKYIIPFNLVFFMEEFFMKGLVMLIDNYFVLL